MRVWIYVDSQVLTIVSRYELLINEGVVKVNIGLMLRRGESASRLCQQVSRSL